MPSGKEDESLINFGATDASSKSSLSFEHSHKSDEESNPVDLIVRHKESVVQLSEEEVCMLSGSELSSDGPCDSLHLHDANLHESRCTKEGILRFAIPASSIAAFLMCETSNDASNFLAGIGLPSFNVEDENNFMDSTFEIRLAILGSDAVYTAPKEPTAPKDRHPDEASTGSGSSASQLQAPTYHFHSQYVVFTKRAGTNTVRASSFYTDSSRCNSNKTHAVTISTKLLYGIEKLWPSAKMDYLNVSRQPIRINFPEAQQDLTCWVYSLAALSCFNELPSDFSKGAAEDKLNIMTQDVVSILQVKLFSKFDDLVARYRKEKSIRLLANEKTIYDLASMIHKRAADVCSTLAKSPKSVPLKSDAS